MTPVCLAFGKGHRMDQFFIQSLEMGSACHGLGEAKSEGKSFLARRRQGIISYSLDDFLDLDGAILPHHIKIDVDGHEKVIIDHAKNLLCSDMMKSIIIEVNDSISHGEIEKTIESYKFKEEKRDQWETPGSKIYNILYTR